MSAIKVLMVDNYDSFTFNIVQYLGELGADVTVVRNDEVTVDELQRRFDASAIDRLVISPGPCSPAEAGISVPAIRHFAGKLPSCARSSSCTARPARSPPRSAACSRACPSASP
jgi:anthranilate synthase component 2